jgi:hypothetical protein
MILAGLLGIAAGFIGFSPLLLARLLARHRKEGIRSMSIPIGLGLVLASLLLLMALLFIASRMAPDVFLAFGVGTVVAFFACTIVLLFLEIRKA